MSDMYPGLPSRFGDALKTHHSIRVRLELLTLEQDPVSEVTASVLDGQVDLDGTADVDRAFSGVLLDAEHQLGFDTNSPADGALFGDRMLRVWYDVRTPGGPWDECPIFTGPVSSFKRDGVQVELGAQGKELLAMGSAWRTKTYKKGTLRVDVIEDVMRHTGERHFALAQHAGRLAHDMTLTPATVPWEFVQRIAAQAGMQLFYDGRGTLRLRDRPGTASWHFRTGTGGTIVSPVGIDFDTSSVKNAVKVVGKKPKGAKHKVSGKAVAGPHHPLSPARLGRNGEPRYLGEFIEDSSIGSNREADRLAETRLESLLLEGVSAEFSAFVIPHLDPYDVVGVATDAFSLKTRLLKASIPLTVGGRMSVGYNKRTTPPRRKSLNRRSRRR